MNKTFLDVLEQLEKTSGTNDKIKIIAENEDVEHFQEYLQIALDKRYVYGVKKIVCPEIKNPLQVDIQTFFDGNPGRITNFAWHIFYHTVQSLKSGRLSGHEAQYCIEACKRLWSDAEKKWYTKAILKDLASVGMGVGLVNKGIPGCIYEYDCMLAMQEEKIEKATYPAHVPLKYDGVRGQVFLNEQSKVFSLGWPGLALPLGRSGLPFYQLGFMIPYIEKLGLKNVVLDGEFHVNHNLNDAQSVTGFEEKKKEDFIGKSGKVSKGWEDHLKRKAEVDALKEKMKFVVFDVLTLDEWSIQTCTREEVDRYANMHAVVKPNEKVEVQEAVVADSYEEAREIAERNMTNGFEGAIIKPLTGVYEWKRSYNWIKIKEEVETDVLILGVVKGDTKFNGDGTPKPDMMGKFTVTDGTRTFEVGTGKGWGETFRQHALENPEEYIGRVMKITAQKFTDDSAIQPRFGCWRDDKTREDILGKD